MLLFYVDEYGDHSLRTDPNDPASLKSGVSPWFLLGAVGIPDSSRKPLAEALFALKQKHFGEDVGLAPWADSEIKGRYLFRASRSVATGNVLQKPSAYASLTSPKQVESLVTDIGRIFDTYRPTIFCVGIDKLRILERKPKLRVDPLGAAYAYLEQRVALTMERLHAGQGALLVADQQTQHETYFRSGEMNRVRDKLTRRLVLKPNYNLVLDKPLWVDTELSSWDREILQLADVAAYSAAECLRRGEAPTEACYLWEQVRSHMAIQWSTGSIESGGLAIYPKPTAYPKTKEPAEA